MDSQNKEFIKQYLVTALWSSSDDNEIPLDENFDIDNVDFDSIKRTVKDCLEFISKAEKLDLLYGFDYSTAGHDFWLTRNGHGAGFWDGDYEEHGEKLSELSKEFGEVYCATYYEFENDLIEIL